MFPDHGLEPRSIQGGALQLQVAVYEERHAVSVLVADGADNPMPRRTVISGAPSLHQVAHVDHERSALYGEVDPFLRGRIPHLEARGALLQQQDRDAAEICVFCHCSQASVSFGGKGQGGVSGRDGEASGRRILPPN